MNIIRNILAVIAGFIIGSMVNMGIIMLGGTLIPPPEGVDPANPESLRANIDQLSAMHYLMPFLAHALGTLAGAIVAALIAFSHKMIFALVIGGLFLLGGIAAAFMIPAPAWFIVADLVLAYLPMAWLGGKIVTRNRIPVSA